MWYQIFLWCLATSVFIHCISACVAFLALRKHSRGVFFPLLVIFIGFLYPVTGGVITSELLLCDKLVCRLETRIGVINSEMKMHII